MIKLLTDLWRECTICAVFFSMSLMVSIDNVSLAQHHSVIERHQLVFHVYAQPCQQQYSILKEEVKQLL